LLPDLTVFDLQLGEHQFVIRFWRDDGKTQLEVLQGKSKVFIERRSFSTQFARAGLP